MLELDSKTISGVRIRATSNGSKKTFTLRVWATPIHKNDKPTTYRTVEMSKYEFTSSQGNTADDWQEFLRRENGKYYLVKL
jgi:hypothetical protein